MNKLMSTTPPKIENDMTHYYCAIAATEQHYVLAAIRKNASIIFEGFTCAPLPVLAQKFKNYGVILAVPDDALEIKTHFFHPQDSNNTIYQKIANQLTTEKKPIYFDFERIEIHENSFDEQLIISYHLRDLSFMTPYHQLGFTLVALEPLSFTQKRTLSDAWQKQVIKKHVNTADSFDLTIAELTLKLLSCEHFYESLES